MDKLQPLDPALFLMNHSSFTDLAIATTLLSDRQYYCFPKSRIPVAKTRLAAEELYKLKNRKLKK